MHRLLEVAFEVPDPGGIGGNARFLTPFLPGPAPTPSSPASRELGVGETLGRFRIEGELGRGGFGVVYRATDMHLGRTVALKVPRPDRVQTVALWDRFAARRGWPPRSTTTRSCPCSTRASSTACSCSSAPIRRASRSRDGWRRGIRPGCRRGSPRPWRSAWRAASDHAHGRGVLHRDLKPSNVLMVAAPSAARRVAPPDHRLRPGHAPRRARGGDPDRVLAGLAPVHGAGAGAARPWAASTRGRTSTPSARSSTRCSPDGRSIPARRWWS